LEGGVSDQQQKDPISDLRLQFEEFADGTIEMRRLAEKARDYRDGNQLTEEELKVLKKRKQPVVVDNKIQDKCDALLGIERQTRTDPKAFPRNPGDEDAAEAATDGLRYVADSSTFSDTVKEACDNLMVEGVCGGEVIVEKKRGTYAAVRMNHIRWDRLFYDIRSLRPDFKDKRYCGFFTWMDEEEAKERWSEKGEVIGQCITSTSVEGPNPTADDKPRYVMTARGRSRLQIFTHYYIQKGKWMRAVWCRAGFLEEPKLSNYKDEDGNPDCCIELQALYRDRDGNPYGLVRRYLDLQDELNKRRSKLLHLLQTKQIKAEKGAFDNVAKAREEIHKPDGVVEYNAGFQVEIDTNLDLAQGQFQLLQETSLAMSDTGPNSALLGNTGSTSGRAKQIDQQAGMLTVGPLFGALKSWKLRMYRHAWNRVKQYWRAEMWVRITNDENKPKFVGFNQPMMAGDIAAEQLKNDPRSPEEKMQILQKLAQDPASRQPAMDERGKQKLKNNVAEMDVDIVIDESPDTVTVQQEQFEQLASLAEKRPDIPTKILIEASNLRNKKAILDEMNGANNPMQAQIAQMQQQMAQLEATLKQHQIEKTQAETAKTVAQTEQIQQATVGDHIDAAIKVSHASDPVKITETVN
jgi:hypothetical protein